MTATRTEAGIAVGGVVAAGPSWSGSSGGMGVLDTCPASQITRVTRPRRVGRPAGPGVRTRGTLPGAAGGTGLAGKRNSTDVTQTRGRRRAARRAAAAVAVPVLAVVLTACGGAGAAESSPPSAVGTAASDSAKAAAQPVSDQPFGTGCGDIPAAGEGSFAGMADDPVGSAMGHNPALRNLSSALRAAHLGEPLDSQQDITVLAPANAAFGALPRDALAALMADTPRLTALLTHHVLQGRLTPDRLPGTHTTLNNDQLTIDVSPEAFTVAARGTVLGKAPARVICGNLQTANATIYIVDQVLTPPAA